MASFNLADFISTRRFSERYLGVARVDYHVLHHTGRQAFEGTVDSIGRIQNSSAMFEGSRKPKSSRYPDGTYPKKPSRRANISVKSTTKTRKRFKQNIAVKSTTKTRKHSKQHPGSTQGRSRKCANTVAASTELGEAAASSASTTITSVDQPAPGQAHLLAEGLERARDHVKENFSQALLDMRTKTPCVAVVKHTQQISDNPASFLSEEGSKLPIAIPIESPATTMATLPCDSRAILTPHDPNTTAEALLEADDDPIYAAKISLADGPLYTSRISLEDDPLYAARISLAERMTRREPVHLKPPPIGEPEVWADSRQALCETVPYFKTPQSGCHQNDQHVYAFLVDGVSHRREYMDSDVVIARAGGGMEADSHGRMVPKRDHRMNESQVQAVLNDARLQNPLVIICGNKNQGALCRMPHRYNVLGWYKPISVWAEKSVGKSGRAWVTAKYRFERLGDRPVWHQTASASISADARQVAGPLVWQTCPQCRHEFPMVYLIGWLCLHAECPLFWKLRDGNDAGYDQLLYNPAFLLHRTAWPVEKEPYSVRPPIPQVGNIIGDNLTYINTRGMCCPRCGRCSSRRLFKGWRCENVQCTYENFPKHIPIQVPMLHVPWESSGNGPGQARNKYTKGVKVDVSYINGFKVYSHTFEGIRGKLVHAVSNTLINQLSGGADAMFAAMQDQENPDMDMHLERRQFGADKSPMKKGTAKSAKTDGEDGDFMTAFSINYGMPYKFVASGASLPFTNAPWPVRACRADLNWACQTFLGVKDHVDLNEELVLAYMEGQKIEYHDDGEHGLGPRIATLSLGSKAKMHMRMKAKHYTGCSKTGILTAERPVPGGLEYERRLVAWKELQKMKSENRAEYEAKRKEIPRHLEIYEKRMKKAEDLMTITLKHGDIVLMEGYEVQQYLEHKVVPAGPLRFALTCRTVLPHHLAPEERPGYEVEGDEKEMSSLRAMAEGIVSLGVGA